MRPAPGLVVIAIVALLSRPALADDIEDAIQSMRAGNFAEAYCILKPYAENGDAEAQYNIGWMYMNGYGLAMNDSLALEWWQRASAQGNTDASFSIAMLYSLGEGRVKKDMDKAIEYYLLAVKAGSEDASMIIRSMLARDDSSIQSRKADIIKRYGPVLGPVYEVNVDRANLRSGPSLEDKVVTVLEQGAALVDLSEKEKWMQVGVLASGDIAWVYKPLLQAQAPAKTSNQPD
jgi:hypothetical protein